MEAGGGKTRLYGMGSSVTQVPSVSQALEGKINNTEIKQACPHQENRLKKLSQNT